MISTLIQDIRYALRQLRKAPGFTATAVLTLALGIGANAAIFTLVNAVLMKNLPVADPKMLVRIGDNNDCCVSGGRRGEGDYTLFPTQVWENVRKNTPEFEELAGIQAGFHYRPVTVRRDGNGTQARSVIGEFVSGNYFRTFGLQPQAGRLFIDTDDVTGAPMMAVMSYETWRRDYAGDASVVGSTFWVNTKPVTVVGIAPEGFYGDRLESTPPDFYLPIESMPMLANAPYVHAPKMSWLYIVGRIKPGVSLPALQQKITAEVRQSFLQSGMYSPKEAQELAKVHVVLRPGGAGIQSMRENYASNLQMLMAISGLVLLIACANIANLLLVRGMSRKAEMSVRTALGAARSRIVRQLLTESVMLAGLGGIAGLVVAFAGTKMILALAFPGAESVTIHASPSFEVIGFAFGLSLLTGVLFGVAPSWIAAQAQPAEVLRTGTRTTAAGASLLQRTLVVLQAAMSLVLLIGAGLFSQSLNKLEKTDLKLNETNRYIVHINPQAAGYSQKDLGPLYRTMEERFHAAPGVVKVGISSYTPMEDDNWGNSVQIQGLPDIHKGASVVRASAEYFDSVGTRVVMGRSIGVQDAPGAPAVSVVNQAFVKTFFKPGMNPVGQHFGSPGSVGDFEIVGVVEDTAYQSAYWKNHEMYFLAPLQRPASDKDPIENDESLYAGAIVVQTDRPMNNMEQLARSTLAGINPNLAVVKFQTFHDQVADQFNEERMTARLTMLFGGLALLLATIGLYGVTSYTVARRTSEIGIRMALGAERTSVVGMVMRGALLQAALGLAIGIPVAIFCVRYVKSQLYEVKSVDIGLLATAMAVLAAAAVIAGLIPAGRAASTDPVKALRTE